MDKYEFQIKTEQMEKLIEKGDFKTAAKIADSIDWRKVRNVELLMKVSDIYENLERYEDSFEILNMAYDCAPIGRMIVYKMVEVATKMGDFDEAIELYKEFIKIAPHDLGRYVLKYEIYKARGSSVEDQIAILEEYKGREYQEKWAYELAMLYYKEGMLSKCIEECDDLILWFSEGEYVVKAMELKMRIQPLTASQEEKYRQLVQDSVSREIEVKPVNMDEFNTTNLQAALAESLQDFIREEHEGELSPDPIPPSPIREEESKEVLSQTDEFPEETVQSQGKEFPEEAVSKPEDVRIPRFLGQDASGQLTFDMEENVLERQITGQMTIEEILSEWEVKKKAAEEAIVEAARREEEKKKERERLRATGKLPELGAGVVTTVPEDVQRIIDEIEGRLPVKIHVEPIIRTGRNEEQREEPSRQEKPREEILASADTDVELPEGIDDIEQILEMESFEKPEPVTKVTEETVNQVGKEQQADGGSKKEPEPDSPTSMIEKLEKALEAEVSGMPPGQLTEEQEKLFAYFISVRGMKQQLADVLAEDRIRERREDSLVGNLVITGECGSGKTTLAADIVKALQKQRKVKGAKMAKIAADSLNKKDVSAVVAKLGGGALVIEKAGNLKSETAVQLSHAMTRRTGGLLVILEDEQEEIRKLFIRCESLGAKFTRTIEIPTFTNKELVAFGESYAGEQDCVLDEMAVLALYNRIGNNQTSDHLVNVAEVKDMIDTAIERAEKKGLLGRLKKGRRDEFGHTVLMEKDFEIS